MQKCLLHRVRGGKAFAAEQRTKNKNIKTKCTKTKNFSQKIIIMSLVKSTG